jgi:V/A-type H+-transporting ATPase subunit E
MSIENILKRIEEETEASEREILKAAEAEAVGIRERYEKAAEKLRDELSGRAGKKADEEKRRLIVNEQLELKKALLAKKREILDEVYAEARKRAVDLSDSDYIELMKALVLAKAVTGTEEIIVPDERHELFDKEFLVSLNREHPGGGFSYAKERGDFEWGVVLREGKRIVDLSLDVLFEQLKERVEPKIASVLFVEDNGQE